MEIAMGNFDGVPILRRGYPNDPVCDASVFAELMMNIFKIFMLVER